jgi:eukaryotic-like serine/threonine-protein kinase
MRPGDEVAGRYRLDELQGQGPMSEVWRAQDDTLDRTVALKILSPTADLGRFRREAQVVAALAHENVMRVYDYGEDEAGPFMALERLPGGTLEGCLEQGPLPPAETHRIATGMAAGLAHLHDRGLVHRDLKPANVLFDEEGRPKLGDFGLARGAAGSGTLTEAGTVLGTAAYISPEQAAGRPAGAASDVYSFGVILFRMLTGRCRSRRTTHSLSSTCTGARPRLRSRRCSQARRRILPRSPPQPCARIRRNAQPTERRC